MKRKKKVYQPRRGQNYAEKQQALAIVNQDAGAETMVQFAWDVLTLTLNDSTVMGKDVFGCMYGCIGGCC